MYSCTIIDEQSFYAHVFLANVGKRLSNRNHMEARPSKKRKTLCHDEDEDNKMEIMSRRKQLKLKDSINIAKSMHVHMYMHLKLFSYIK